MLKRHATPPSSVFSGRLTAARGPIRGERGHYSQAHSGQSSGVRGSVVGHPASSMSQKADRRTGENRDRIQATPANPSPVYARVYLDDLFYGEIESLYNIPSNSIERIEYLGSLDATTRYGTGHMGGVIRVTTR